MNTEEALVPTEVPQLVSTEPLNLAKIAADAQLIEVDDSVIDVSEVEDESDKEFLKTVGHEVLRVNAQGDYIIKKVAEYVEERKSLTLGPLVLEVRRRFAEKGEKGLTRFWYSLGYWDAQFASIVGKDGVKLKKQTNAMSYRRLTQSTQAYKAILDFRILFANVSVVSPDEVLVVSDKNLTAIDGLPTEYKEKVFADIATGAPPNEATLKTLAKDPEVKLSKAEELLALAKERNAAAEKKWADVKADKTIRAGTAEYQNANMAAGMADKSVAKLEAQVAALKAEIEEKRASNERSEKAKALAEAAQKEAEAQLEALKLDDTHARRRRVAALSQSLTATVPDLLSDLQKYFAEREHYELSVREGVEDNCRALVVFLNQKLNGENQT